ncbi:MAG: pyruvate ferredoxin oxidoreductase [Candidatus Bathyarchaeota archaeon]|nr:pyruvate ferredoxin oxidoreductase [Candidatus Bathyarchaeota archaeon]
MLKQVPGGKELITGCVAVAHAIRLADVDVIAAYPIRPYTGVMNAVAEMIANGEFDAEYMVADSEHSQFEIGKHASLVGARAFVGSSGVGWAYAAEPIIITATNRAPIVALVGNRALDDPGAFGTEHNETLMTRDIGWMFSWAADAQEAMDLTLLAYRISEDPKVMLPSAVCVDGSFVTHIKYPVEVSSPEQVEKFLPPYRPMHVLHPDHPITVAPQCNEEYVFETRKQMDEAVRREPEVIVQAHKDFSRIFDRQHDPFLERYMTEDSDILLIGIGSMALAARAAVREFRDEGKKIGFVRIKRFRPFPTDELKELLLGKDAVGIIDVDFSFGSPLHGGVLYHEIRSTLYDEPERPPTVNFIAGLGGRPITVGSLREMADITIKTAEAGKPAKNVHWIDVRE